MQALGWLYATSLQVSIYITNGPCSDSKPAGELHGDLTIGMRNGKIKKYAYSFRSFPSVLCSGYPSSYPSYPSSNFLLRPDVSSSYFL